MRSHGTHEGPSQVWPRFLLKNTRRWNFPRVLGLRGTGREDGDGNSARSGSLVWFSVVEESVVFHLCRRCTVRSGLSPLATGATIVPELVITGLLFTFTLATPYPNSEVREEGPIWWFRRQSLVSGNSGFPQEPHRSYRAGSEPRSSDVGAQCWRAVWPGRFCCPCWSDGQFLGQEATSPSAREVVRRQVWVRQIPCSFVFQRLCDLIPCCLISASSLESMELVRCRVSRCTNEHSQLETFSQRFNRIFSNCFSHDSPAKG